MHCSAQTKNNMPRPHDLKRSPRKSGPPRRRKSKRGSPGHKLRRPSSPRRRRSPPLFSPSRYQQRAPPPNQPKGFFSRFFGADPTPATTTVALATTNLTATKVKSKPVYPKLDVSKDEPGEPMCVACMDNKAAVLFTPCKHLKMCRACTLELAAASGTKMFLCPNCRGTVQGYGEVFM